MQLETNYHAGRKYTLYRSKGIFPPGAETIKFFPEYPGESSNRGDVEGKNIVQASRAELRYVLVARVCSEIDAKKSIQLWTVGCIFGEKSFFFYDGYDSVVKC